MRKTGAFLLLLATMVLAAGCAANTGAKVYDDKEAIAKDYNSYNLVHSKASIDGNTLTGSAELMEGMGTIWEYKAADEEDVSITYSMNVYKGKAKLVLIAPDNTLKTLIECTADSDGWQEGTADVQIREGKNRIKLIGGKGTEIVYEISADKGEIKSFGD